MNPPISLPLLRIGFESVAVSRATKNGVSYSFASNQIIRVITTLMEFVMVLLVSMVYRKSVELFYVRNK